VQVYRRNCVGAQQVATIPSIMKDRPTENTQPKKAEHMATNPMGRSHLPLNTEIWVDRMLAFVRMEHFVFVASVSHQMKEFYQAHCDRVQNPPMAMNQQNATPPSPFPAAKVCTFIASRRNLQVLKWARQEKKCPWIPNTFALAAAGGYLETIRYAVEVEQDCPWNEATCKMAASIGNLDCLQAINSHSIIKLLKTAMASSSPTFTFPNPVVTRVHGAWNYASLLVANPSPPSPQAIFDQYNLQNCVHNGFDHLEICKGMYGLPQAGLLANNQLGPHLALQGYIQSLHTHGLFIHKSRPILCCLMVDDFVIKYVEHYTVTGVAPWKLDHFQEVKLGSIPFSCQNPCVIARKISVDDDPLPPPRKKTKRDKTISGCCNRRSLQLGRHWRRHQIWQRAPDSGRCKVFSLSLLPDRLPTWTKDRRLQLYRC
jgi:hypothetical protein